MKRRSLYYKLKPREYVYLILLMVIGYIFTITQKYYIPEIIRPITLIIVFAGIFMVYYKIIKPEDMKKLSNYFAGLTFAIVSVIVIIQHIIIKFDLTYKAGIIIFASYIAPKIAYFILKVVILKNP